MLKFVVLCLLLTCCFAIIDTNSLINKINNKYKKNCVPLNYTCIENYECCDHLKCYKHKCIPNYRCFLSGHYCNFDNECCSNICVRELFTFFGSCYRT